MTDSPVDDNKGHAHEYRRPYFDPRINVSHIISILVMGGSVTLVLIQFVNVLGKMDKRTALLEAQQTHFISQQATVDRVQDQRIVNLRTDLKDLIERINVKLDKLTERELWDIDQRRQEQRYDKK